MEGPNFLLVTLVFAPGGCSFNISIIEKTPRGELSQETLDYKSSVSISWKSRVVKNLLGE
jgi:hypothetical protein